MFLVLCVGKEMKKYYSSFRVRDVVFQKGSSEKVIPSVTHEA